MTNNIRSTWNLQNWLDYLESIEPIKYNLRIENVREVARRLDVLVSKVPVITVGGTNGKGSTVAALTALYSSAGYSVGHFTSPHLIKFNERICVSNKQISDEDAAVFMLEEGTKHHTAIIALTSYKPENVKNDCKFYKMEGVVGKPLTEIQANQIIDHFIYKNENGIDGFS